MSVTIFDPVRDTRDQQNDLLIGASIIAHLALMAVYWSKYDDAIDARDAKIDKQIDFMQDVQDYKVDQDLPMLRCKKDILTELALPAVDMCSDAVRCADESEDDGHAIDLKSSHLADQSCDGIPEGWYAHEGTLAAGNAGSHAGGMISNNARRMQEQFRGSKTTLVSQAQHNMKAVFNSGEVLAMYAQGASIHQGFADIYISGFNSAGAAAGVGLGQLASGTQSGNPTFGGSISSTPANSTGSSNVDYGGYV